MNGACWEANLRIIKAQYPGLAEQLAGADTANLRTEASAAGPPTLIIDGVHAHSPRDPVREGRRLAETLPPGEGPVLLLGFGLGYAAEALVELDRNRPLVIVERRGGALKKALEERDLGPLLGGGKLAFVVGGDGGAATAALGLFEGEAGRSPPAMLRGRALAGGDGEWYAALERRVRAWASRDEVNLATLRRFGKRWVRNLAANMGAIRDLPGVARLEGLLAAPGGGGETPVPVFLAAAGPSLDRIRPLLGEIARRCLVIAVDTSLRFLLEAGTDPDFVLSVDPQFWNCRHLDHAPARRSCLVAESAVYPPALRHPFGRTFLCGSLFPLGRFVEDRVDPKGKLGAGGSVATSAWDFSRLLGARTIFIAGLDLGFPGLKTHFKGARFEEKALAESGRLDPAETRSVRALRDGQPFRAAGEGGEAILTDRRLSLYAAWFEEHFRRFPGIQNFRLGRAGLVIPGLESVEAERLLALPPRRGEIRARLEGAFAALGQDFSAPEARAERGRRYEEARGELVRGLGQIRDEAARAAALAAGGRALNAAGGDRLLRELEGITRSITENPVKDAAGFLFPPASELEAALETPPPEALKRHLEFSEKFYRALAAAAAYPLGLLGQSQRI